MDEGHLSFSTMGSLTIQDQVTTCQLPEGMFSNILNKISSSPSPVLIWYLICRDLSRAIDCALSGQELPFVPKPRFPLVPRESVLL